MESLQQPCTHHEGLSQIKYVHNIFQKYFCLLFKQYGGNFLNIFFLDFFKIYFQSKENCFKISVWLLLYINMN